MGREIFWGHENTKSLNIARKKRLYQGGSKSFVLPLPPGSVNMGVASATAEVDAVSRGGSPRAFAQMAESSRHR